ncbi:hypothetical protein [Roseovarius sp.]|uniref:hypothetical protein n=1 Tax=Roseovarius sp. TaxID=1486281 RepID=UPI003A969019
MQITLIPQRRDEVLTLGRTGDMLVINGEAFDFSPLPDGATLPREAIASNWFAGPVERIGGVLHLSLVVPFGASAPPQTVDPAPLTLTADGPVALPPYDVETE